MDMILNNYQRLDAAIAEGDPHQFLMRIQKLRWIGMDSEANEMQRALYAADPHCVVLAGPVDTD
jgi:hypothetical protein